MRLFAKKSDEKEGEQTSRNIKSKLKDLKPENRKKRKEIIKPWGKKERLIVLSLLLISVFVSVLFSLSSGNFKFPKLPVISLDTIFQGETIMVGDKNAIEKALRQRRADEITGEFIKQTNGLKGTYAFKVIDLGSGFEFGVNNTKVMQAASLIKLPLMLYAQGKTDDSKIEAMGKRSDNAVFTELVNVFGRQKVQDYIYELGLEDTMIEENSTTPNEIGELLLKIYKENNQKILDALTDTVFEKWIVAGVPKEIKVSHKYGREMGVVNDAGIIYSQNPFILVIVTQEVNETDADRLIPELTEMIYSKYEEKD